MGAMPTDPHLYTNRLARETSPYLLQHAHNPVDWYPWGSDAFDAAKRDNKPIFLSVGYSTCYWCHVMERQCFENEAIAKIMNEKFINIKVDREERPDVDQLYMTAVQILTRQGGWPMSVFLTHELKPFYGGTYFPPTDAHGRPGFPRLLAGLEEAWKHRRGELEASGSQLEEMLERVAQPGAPESPVKFDSSLIAKIIEESIADYDPQFGGFGQAPKFPRQTLLEVILAYLALPAHPTSGPAIGPDASQREHLTKMLKHTLDALAAGGIRDHLAGGFHRYSTDQQWLVPHFEIMLYDNAMLGYVFTEASRLFAEPSYASVARGIFDFVLREMTSPEGAFYTAFDAEVDAQEGLSYLWTKAEIEELLGGEDARLFNRVYGLDSGPNFADPHHGSGKPDKNILHLPRPIESAATQLKLSSTELAARLRPMQAKLLDARRKRKQPLLDTKILTSWNALMIRALALAGKTLDEPRYTEAATRSADFLLKSHRTTEGRLYRTSRDGPAKYDAFLDDYAFLIDGLLTLADVGAGTGYRTEAEALATIMRERFLDVRRGGFFFTASDARDILVRQKTATDSPLPSGNGVAASVLIRLGELDVAKNVLAAFASHLQRNGEGMSSLLNAGIDYLKIASPFIVAAKPNADEDRPPSPQQTAANVVAIGGVWTSETQLEIELAIADGYHIQSNQAGKELIATTISVQDIDATIDYPAGVRQTFVFADQAINVYTGRVMITLQFRVPPAKLPRLAITYQACTDDACLPPITKHLQIKRA